MTFHKIILVFVLTFFSLILPVAQAEDVTGEKAKLEAWEKATALKERKLEGRINVAAPRGETYQALVPDTLDLAERGALSLNCLLGMLDPKSHYELYAHSMYFTNPAYMGKSAASGWANVPKVIEALPEMRLMSGSGRDLETEQALLRRVMAMCQEDGFLYIPPAGGRSDMDRQWPETALVPLTARLLLAMLYWHEYDGNPFWLEQARKMYGSIRDKLVRIGKDGDAYIPLIGVWGNYPRSGWPTDAPLTTPEGDAAVYLLGCHVRAIARYAEVTHDKEALVLAGKLAQTLRQPRLWGAPAQIPSVSSAERGHYGSHVHSRVAGLRGLLEYAIAANDADLKQFVRQGYEFTRTLGIPEIGWFPVGLGHANTEGCCSVDPVMLAVRLAEEGNDAIWEDVDQYARNMLVELQLTDSEQLKKCAAHAKPYEAVPSKDSQALPTASERWRPADVSRMETTERVIERSLGAFAATPRTTDYPEPWSYCCCSHNGAHALYHVWNGIVQDLGDGAAQVNLLLNRASAQLDLDSYLPYEGKVVIKIKTARRLNVRLPDWVAKAEVRCALNEKAVANEWLNRRLLFLDLKPGDRITIQFPMVERTIRRTEPVSKITYTILLRGNTVLDITPRTEEVLPVAQGEKKPFAAPLDQAVGQVKAEAGSDGAVNYRFFLRKGLRGDKAPMVRKSRFAPATGIRP